MKHVKIKDHAHLVKDLHTGAVTNANDEHYHSALIRKKNKQIIKTLQAECDKLKERVHALEQAVFQYK